MKQKRPRRVRGVIDLTKGPNRAIIDAYESGMSASSIAIDLGIETSEVQKTLREFSPGSIRRKSKAKLLPGTLGATKESPFVLTPNQTGQYLARNMLYRNCSAVLHALINVAGVSRADVAKATGLTRGRIGHYLNLDEQVPEERERQFYEFLRDITQGYDEALADEKKHQELLEEYPDLDIGKRPVPEVVATVRDIVKVCRRALADYEAAQQSKDDADEAEFA